MPEGRGNDLAARCQQRSRQWTEILHLNRANAAARRAVNHVRGCLLQNVLLQFHSARG